EKPHFSEWELEIRVSFRSGVPPQPLKAALQSGGERSVSTMLFLLCLQSVTETPFRVVDEINQGMDAHNERMIFEQISRSSGHERQPQYFLVTPKLLPNLTYTDSMTSLVVYNGKGMVDQNAWCLEAFCARARALREEGNALA